jgi:hypothetical protein
LFKGRVEEERDSSKYPRCIDNLLKNVQIQRMLWTHRAQQILARVNRNETIPRHAIINFLKTTEKEKVLMAAKEYYRGVKMRRTTDFSFEIMQGMTSVKTRELGLLRKSLLSQ